jgi:hypothetical protein
MKDVITHVFVAKTFEGCNIGWTLDNADNRVVSLGVSTNLTESANLGNVATAHTEFKFLRHFNQRLG